MKYFNAKLAAKRLGMVPILFVLAWGLFLTFMTLICLVPVVLCIRLIAFFCGYSGPVLFGEILSAYENDCSPYFIPVKWWADRIISVIDWYIKSNR